jgi:Kef-type K+ transport system membrane component KefB
LEQFAAEGQIFRGAGHHDGIAKTLDENLRDPLAVLLIQIVLIVLVSRAVGRAVTKIGQPQVVGEMIAGILLGPSFLGQISPSAMNFLFPATSMNTLRMFSQIGVIIFMFLVGTDVEIDRLFQKAHTAVLVSHASIIVPFLLGTTLSLFTYRNMAPPGISFTAFALFIGVAMSITAFPVLARIVEERGLTRSGLGVMSLGCAAVDDATAWCILAAVRAIVRADGPGKLDTDNAAGIDIRQRDDSSVETISEKAAPGRPDFTASIQLVGSFDPGFRVGSEPDH